MTQLCQSLSATTHAGCALCCHASSAHQQLGCAWPCRTLTEVTPRTQPGGWRPQRMWRRWQFATCIARCGAVGGAKALQGEHAQCASKQIKYMLACVFHLPCHSWNQSAFVKAFRCPNCGHCSAGPPMMPHGERLGRMLTQMPVGCYAQDSCAPCHVPLAPCPTACNALPCAGLAY